jgi:hypothetical protein
MRTRAQASRDAALRRLTRLNHSLALAAVVGAGVVTDVVANTPAGHATTITTTGETSTTGQVTLLTSPQISPSHKPRHHSHRAPQPAVQQAPQPAAQPTPQPTVVAVSGGS